jgi:hypothetical protein
VHVAHRAHRQVHPHVVVAGVGRGHLDGGRVQVHADHVSGAVHGRRDRQDSRAGADVQHGEALQVQVPQCLEAAQGRVVVPGPERPARVQHDADPAGLHGMVIGQPGGHDVERPGRHGLDLLLPAGDPVDVGDGFPASPLRDVRGLRREVADDGVGLDPHALGSGLPQPGCGHVGIGVVVAVHDVLDGHA